MGATGTPYYYVMLGLFSRTEHVLLNTLYLSGIGEIARKTDTLLVRLAFSLELEHNIRR